MRTKGRSYLVSLVPEEGKAAENTFVLAPGPKAAVARVARMMAPSNRVWAEFTVTRMRDRQALKFAATQKYEVSFDRVVHGVVRTS